MQKYLLILVLALSMTSIAQAKKGVLSGGVDHAMPGWFKESFMEIAEDTEEAKEENKHVILFFHVAQCPYCAQMLDNFDAELKPYIQKNFDIIAINTRGAREVAFSEDVSMTERQLARKLKVQYTPTLIYLDGDNNQVLRTNGYRDKDTMRNILSFVASKSYKKTSLNQYLTSKAKKLPYPKRPNPLFKNITDLSKIKTPLAVIFDQADCAACDKFYNHTLKGQFVKDETSKLTWVRLNAQSNQAIITPDGKKTTPLQWANTLKLSYRPGLVLFDQGKEIERVDTFLYLYHFGNMLRYVADRHYKKYERYLQYSGVRRTELLDMGVDINIVK